MDAPRKRKIWAWLSDQKNQRTLKFIGGGFGIVVAAAWAFFIYVYPPKSSAPPSQIIEQHVEESSAGVIQTREGKVYITKGISPEQFQRLAAELGITQTALKNFFDILEQKDVPIEEYDSTLRKIAKRYKELEEKLERFSSSDPAVTAFKKKARETLIKGDFKQAEALLNKAINLDTEAAKQVKQIKEARLLSAATSMSEIGELKEIQLDYKEAVSYYRQASELVPKGKNLILAIYLSKWGGASYKSGKYKEAEKSVTRSLKIYEKALGPDHPRVAISMNDLAVLYRAQGRYAEAEPLYRRSLEILKKTLGPDHPHVATALSNLAFLYQAQGKYSESELFCKSALKIREQALGPDHPDVALSLNNLAVLYKDQGRYVEADPLQKRSLKIVEKALGPDHPHVATTLNNLAVLYRAQRRYVEAEPLYKRSLKILEKALGPDHPRVAILCKNMAKFYREFGKEDEAEKLEEYVRKIRLNQ